MDLVVPDQSPRLDALVVTKLALEGLHLAMLHVMNDQARALREYFMANLAVTTSEQAFKLVYVILCALNGDSKLSVGILWQCFEASVAFSARNRRFRGFRFHLWSRHA